MTVLCLLKVKEIKDLLLLEGYFKVTIIMAPATGAANAGIFARHLNYD